MGKKLQKATSRPVAKSDARLARLPNAPLVEVVFEIRWKLHSGESLPPMMRTDPLVLPLLNDFTVASHKAGFTAVQDMAKPDEVAGHTVLRRFRTSQDQNFPLLQIGSGIFAANEGPLYEWAKYKAFVLAGVKRLVASYPVVSFFPLSPIYLELRYVDAFDQQAVSEASAILNFLARHTSMDLSAPKFMNDKSLFEDRTDARIAIQKEAKGWADSKFILEIASAANAQTKSPAIQMQTKVVTQNPSLNMAGKAFEDKLGNWLDFAHGITSPFFRSFISEDLLAKFEVSPK